MDKQSYPIAHDAGIEALRMLPPGRHTVVGCTGLNLLVTKPGVGSWVFRRYVGGKRKDTGLGGLKRGVTVGQAIAKCEAIRAGEADVVKQVISAPVFEGAGDGPMTYAQASEIWLVERYARRRKDVEGVSQVRRRIERYIYPVLGDKLLPEVEEADVIALLNDGALPASIPGQLKSHINQLFKWAKAKNLVRHNPASADINEAVPEKYKADNHPFVMHKDIKGVVAGVMGSSSSLAVRGALGLLMLTGLRISEVANARWEEVDLESEIWLVPLERMKKGLPHRVPLSRQAVELVKAMGVKEAGYVFESPDPRKDGPVGRWMVGKLFSDHATKGPDGRKGVAHGLRSTFTTWAQDNGVPRDVRQECVAHVIRDSSEAAYARSDMLEVRRPVMQAWADYTGFDVAMLVGADKVVELETQERPVIERLSWPTGGEQMTLAPVASGPRWDPARMLA